MYSAMGVGDICGYGCSVDYAVLFPVDHDVGCMEYSGGTWPTTVNSEAYFCWWVLVPDEVEAGAEGACWLDTSVGRWTATFTVEDK